MQPDLCLKQPAQPPAALTAIKHLYIHIPFCHQRCSYCDFNTYANMEDRIVAYVEALCAELAMLAEEYQARVSASSPPPERRETELTGASIRPTIFFGGGTPSLLTVAQLERILAAAHKLVPLDGAEITLEANPGSVLGADTDALTYFKGLRAIGVNRLSMGVQSLHDPTLRILGRTHTAAEARTCFEQARRAGFDNINLDFIFGLPGQTVAQWQADLAEIITWGTDHFALYSLILEERTPLYAQVLRGQVHVPDDDATAEMYEAALVQFAAAGYTQYEISNWARNGTHDACHHNLAYWFNSDYLAAGAGAHGHVYPQRYADILGIDDYVAAVRAGRRPVAEITDLTPHDLSAETMFMGLRLNAGVRRAHFRERCGVEMDEVYGSTLTELTTLGLLECDETAVRLTPRGRMLGNQVFERFV